MPKASSNAQAFIAARPPASREEYVGWLQSQHGLDLSGRYPNYYDTVVAAMHRQLEESSFWRALLANLPEIDDTYRTEKSVGLLTADPWILRTKAWTSFLDKTFRKNVKRNLNWPDPPDGGWLLPDTWFERVGDLVRTTLYVRYLDGVEFLSQAVERLAVDDTRTCMAALQPGEDGYYAMHLEVSAEFEVPRRDWDTMRLHTSFEIQVTTGVKGLIKELLESQ